MESSAMQRQMRKMRVGLLFLLGIALSACAADGMLGASSTGATPYPPPGYSHTVQTPHVALFWNCTRPESGVLQLAGLAMNPWSNQPIRFLEFEFVGVRGEERTVSEAKAEARDIQLFTNQSTPFRLDLRLTGSEDRFDLYYRYRFQEGDHSPRIVMAAWDGPMLLAQVTRFRVRDACSDTQHLVR
jgi:hypothetical protein